MSGRTKEWPSNPNWKARPEDLEYFNWYFAPTPFHPELVAAVPDAADVQGYPHQDIISGAGHDAVYPTYGFCADHSEHHATLRDLDRALLAVVGRSLGPVIIFAGASR